MPIKQASSALGPLHFALFRYRSSVILADAVLVSTPSTPGRLVPCENPKFLQRPFTPCKLSNPFIISTVVIVFRVVRLSLGFQSQRSLFTCIRLYFTLAKLLVSHLRLSPALSSSSDKPGVGRYMGPRLITGCKMSSCR